jgi:hypothetical protein
MRMQKLEFDEFVNYVRDNRAKIMKPDPHLHFFYHNPIDAHGCPSSFVFVVLVDSHKSGGGVYSAGSKFNVEDKEFSLNYGLKEACNRLWSEFQGTKSLYGKGFKRPQEVKPTISPLTRILMSMIHSSAIQTGHLKPARYPKAKAKLLNSKLSKEAVHEAKKTPHS